MSTLANDEEDLEGGDGGCVDEESSDSDDCTESSAVASQTSVKDINISAGFSAFTS